MHCSVHLILPSTHLGHPFAFIKPPSLFNQQDKIHILESAIVTWTKQIKNVLKADPDAPLKVGCACILGLACA